MQQIDWVLSCVERQLGERCLGQVLTFESRPGFDVSIEALEMYLRVSIRSRAKGVWNGGFRRVNRG